ncbi:MAG: M23 family metallopeptidase [bacterium]
MLIIRLLFFLLPFCAFSHFASDVQVLLSTKVLALGDTLRVDVYSDKKLSAYKLYFGHRYFPLSLRSKFKGRRYHYVAYLALSRKSFSGSYAMDILLNFDNKPSFRRRYMIKVDHDYRPKGKVRLSKKTQKLRRKKRVLAEENKLILAAFSTYTEHAYFRRKAFDLPIEGRISSKFAANREYSGGGTSSHAGVDLVAVIGTDVEAANDGKVILSRDFVYHGSTVMIDHGLGIVSIYNHLLDRYVEEGEFVRGGDYIGALGKSGVVSAAHLHWGMGVQNIRVNPLFWVKNMRLVK